MANYRQQAQWTAEQVLAYIVNLEAADQQNENQAAFATAYNYFMNLGKKKISWSVHLQKLAYQFIELAFDNNKHASIKDVLKSYRSITQGQYSESLKDVLEHYRDRKLQAILEEDILHDNIELIRQLPSIDTEQASSTVIFSSFRPQQKKKLEQLRNKLKIVWDGYKYIIQTVRINQKLEEVFKQTLSKVFLFVDKYNRKHEFKSFCRTLRAGLMTAFNKRDRSQQQRAIYIDIQKTEVNDRHIEVRLDQFKVTIKLGLWQQAFQVLEDINNLMKIRKGGLKTNIRYKYFENLALLFKKSNYWHYHAFAFYNKYLAAQKNPKLTAKDKKQLSDKLLLSVLCIPPVTLQSNQSKDSQQKISSMMISSTKIPSKNELFDIIVSAGISQNASPQIRHLWSFMFLEFDLESLTKGLDLLNKITNEEYSEYKTLVEDILIYKQLQSISEIYQRIKIDSLLSLIPLSRQKIQRILLSSYHQKILDFVLDQDQKIIIFVDKSSESTSNPTENFLSIYIDLALQRQKQREQDGKHILRKLEQFVETSEQYYWKIRQYKIDQYRKKLKKPKQDLLNEAHRRKLQQKQQRQRLEAEKLVKEQEALKQAQQRKKIFGAKKIIISDIKDIKQGRVVRILGKKVEDLTDQEIENISLQTLNTNLQEIKTKIQNNRDARFKKAFHQIDYAQRERRQKIEEKIKTLLPSKEQEQKNIAQIKNDSKVHYEQQNTIKQTIAKIMPYLKPKIQGQSKRVQEKYDQQITDFKQRLTDYYRQKIIARAKALAKQNKQKKEQQQRMMRDAENDFGRGAWIFKGVNRVKDTEIPVTPNYTAPVLKFGVKNSNTTSEPKADSWSQPNSQQPQKREAWARKTTTNNVNVNSEQKKQQYQQYQPQQQQQYTPLTLGKKQQTSTTQPPKTFTNSFVPPPAEKKTLGIGFGLGTKKPAVVIDDKKKQQPPKDDGKPRPPKRGYVNVN